MIVILHNIRSSHNVGSIFRTSDGAGVDKIYLCGFTPSPINKVGSERIRLTKVALGAENFIEWEQAKSTTALIDRLKKEGYRIYAVEQTDKSIPHFKIKNEKLDKVALVMGNEVNGLTKGILKRSDKVLEIPMYGEKTSLNVSVAFGVVAYHLKINND
ncbi:MAG: TrmH family RNA methyltransferase [Candidatus Paceibacterota bacterium]